MRILKSGDQSLYFPSFVRTMLAGIVLVALHGSGVWADDGVPTGENSKTPGVEASDTPTSSPKSPESAPDENSTPPDYTPVRQPKEIKPAPVAPEPVKTEPAATTPVAPEPVKTEPAATTPVAPEPVKTEPAATTPVAPEPVKTEPAATTPVAPEPVKTEPAATTPVAPEPVKTEPAATTLVAPEPVKTEPAATTPVAPEPVKTEPAATTPVAPEPVKTEPAATTPVVPEPVKTEPATAKPDVTSAKKQVRPKITPVARDNSPQDSLLGSYLAGRVARGLRDHDAAAKYFGRALKIDPDSDILLEQTFVLQLARGDWDKSLELAKLVVKKGEKHRFSRMVLGLEAVVNDDFAEAENHFSRAELRSPLGKMIGIIVEAWLQEARGESKKAIETLSRLDVMNWSKFYQDYHRAMIADQAGRPTLARKTYQRNVQKRSQIFTIDGSLCTPSLGNWRIEKSTQTVGHSYKAQWRTPPGC